MTMSRNYGSSHHDVVIGMVVVGTGLRPADARSAIENFAAEQDMDLREVAEIGSTQIPGFLATLRRSPFTALLVPQFVPIAGYRDVICRDVALLAVNPPRTWPRHGAVSASSGAST